MRPSSAPRPRMEHRLNDFAIGFAIAAPVGLTTVTAGFGGWQLCPLAGERLR